MAAPTKAKQGDQLMLEGDKCARTTLLKWTPDWEGAFMAYEKAAVCYKSAKDMAKCKKAHFKAADAQCKCNLLHGAARNLEAAAQCAKEQKNVEEAVQAFRRASSLYAENGTTEKAAEVLTQAARSIEDADPDAAADLLIEAISMLEQDAKRSAGDAYKKAIALLIRNKKIERAIEVVGKEITFLEEDGKLVHEVYRGYLTLIVLHLHQNDYVAADKAYNQACLYDGFASSNEGQAAGELLDAFEKGIPETLQSCLSRQVFTYLDGPVLRLARSLRVMGSSGSSATSSQAGAPVSAQASSSAPSDVPKPSEGDLEDEDDPDSLL